ncbi:hypothetical protein HDU85_002392 [Gaertneriomyces sp. JEL0708]|nr:hypothetical protein HDU85_002392 [Gaertneriomyces sp. JEL0708]
MVVIVGHVGADPEFLELPGVTSKTGLPMGYFKFNVATNYSYKVPMTDEYESKVSWNRISVPGDLLPSEVQKGAKVYVHGRLQSWAVEGKYGVEIVARPKDVKVLKQAAHKLEVIPAAQASGEVQYPPLSLQALNASKVGTLGDGATCGQSGT